MERDTWNYRDSGRRELLFWRSVTIILNTIDEVYSIIFMFGSVSFNEGTHSGLFYKNFFYIENYK